MTYLNSQLALRKADKLVSIFYGFFFLSQTPSDHADLARSSKSESGLVHEILKGTKYLEEYLDIHIH